MIFFRIICLMSCISLQSVRRVLCLFLHSEFHVMISRLKKVPEVFVVFYSLLTVASFLFNAVTNFHQISLLWISSSEVTYKMLHQALCHVFEYFSTLLSPQKTMRVVYEVLWSDAYVHTGRGFRISRICFWLVSKM